MKFVIPTQDFNSLVAKCCTIVPLKSTVPILGNILIQAANGIVTVTSTDLTVSIRCFTEAKVLEEGSTTVPAKKMQNLIRELTSANIEFNSNSKHITEIIAESSKFKIFGMDGSEFPSLPDMTGAMTFKVKQSELKDVLYRTAFAVSREDNRYVLTGINMNIANSEASFVGTDGKRLSRARLPLNIDPAFLADFTIPLKAVEEIVSSINNDSDATITLMSDKIGIETGSTMIIAKLLLGDYPDINRVIPEQVGTIVTLHREELMTLLKQISLFTETSHSVRFAFTNGELFLSANTADVGEGRVSMPVNYQGENLDIAFNPLFFLDILRHTKQETVLMGVMDPYTPGIIVDSGEFTLTSKPHSLFVLMPMRLNE